MRHNVAQARASALSVDEPVVRTGRIREIGPAPVRQPHAAVAARASGHVEQVPLVLRGSVPQHLEGEGGLVAVAADELARGLVDALVQGAPVVGELPLGRTDP